MRKHIHDIHFLIANKQETSVCDFSAVLNLSTTDSINGHLVH